MATEFEWTRHAAEAGYLSFQQHQRRDPTRLAAIESPVAPRPSASLSAAMRAAGVDPDRIFGAPAIVSSPITPEIGPRNALTLITRRSGTAESAHTASESAARSFLEGAGGRDIVEFADKIFGRADPGRDANPEITRLRDAVRSAMPEVIERFAKGARSSAEFSGTHRVAAEALIRLTGRPALRVINGVVDRDDPQIGQWAAEVFLPRREIKPMVDATGRIDMKIAGAWSHVGTGTVMAKGVIMTNRHVIDDFAEPIPMPGGKRDFILTADVSINFDELAKDETRRFKIKRVITAGPNAIGTHADIAKLDMAFLEVETDNAGGNALPAPVTTGELPTGVDGPPNLAVVGYPAQPSLDALVDPNTGKVSDDISDRLWELFQHDYGHKYLSPGEVNLGLGSFGGDQMKWAFTHDSTTLAGNSGSCVIRLGAMLNVCGLHFGGAPMRQNLGHGISAVRSIARGVAGVIDPTVFDEFKWV
jgi:S1-C subfamily serine protease